MQDPENRVNLIPGGAAMNMTHGKRGMEDVIVDLGWTAPPVKLVDLNDQLGGNGGQFYYYYV